jgi:hypothetical protein
VFQSFEPAMSALQIAACATSDSIWFPALEIFLFVFAVFAAWKDWRSQRRAGSDKAGTGGLVDSVQADVIRGPVSMGTFYGAYGAITAVLVALAINVDVAKDHRVFFVLFNVVVAAYVCLLNGWVRNRLIGWTGKVAKLERNRG